MCVQVIIPLCALAETGGEHQMPPSIILCLSLSLEITSLARLTSLQAWVLLSPLPSNRLAGMHHQHLAWDVDARI